MSDDELQKKLEEAQNTYYQGYEEYKGDRRPYSELIQDPKYKEHEIDYDRFYQLLQEKQHRYAEVNPDRFPRHREHGYNLYKEDDD